MRRLTLHAKLQSVTAHVDQHVHNHTEDYRERLLAEMDRIAAAEQAKAAPRLSNGRTTH
jgi:hypothetical protein